MVFAVRSKFKLFESKGVSEPPKLSFVIYPGIDKVSDWHGIWPPSVSRVSSLASNEFRRLAQRPSSARFLFTPRLSGLFCSGKSDDIAKKDGQFASQAK